MACLEATNLIIRVIYEMNIEILESRAYPRNEQPADHFGVCPKVEERLQTYDTIMITDTRSIRLNSFNNTASIGLSGSRQLGESSCAMSTLNP